MTKDYQDREKTLQNAFNARIEELAAELDANTDPERIRTLTQEKMALEQSEKHMKQEIEELRAQLERVKGLLDDSERIHRRQLLEETNHAKSLFGDNEALNRKVRKFY